MNPGNGIETAATNVGHLHRFAFTLMNPGNGIETLAIAFNLALSNADFHINESRQRDWNKYHRLRQQ